MKRTLRLGLPLAVLAALIAGVLLATQPWSGEDAVQEAEAGTIQYRLCDTVFEAPPSEAPEPGRERLVVLPTVDIDSDSSPYDPNPKLRLQPELTLAIRGDVDSEVMIDPTSGAVSREHYGTASQRAKLQAILDTLRVEPFDPATAPWPYTDAAQKPAKRVEHGIFEYRPPDPASGLDAGQIWANTITGAVHSFNLSNCRSAEAIGFDPFTGEELWRVRDVHPDDEAAFKTFFDQLDVGVLPSLGDLLPHTP
jgi:hypothetical protein